jgi:hypothetical protein
MLFKALRPSGAFPKAGRLLMQLSRLRRLTKRLDSVVDGVTDLDRLVVIEDLPMRASPEDGGKRVVSILIAVLLPAPIEPRNPNFSPALATSVKESTAVNVPKRRESFSISTTELLRLDLNSPTVYVRVTLHTTGSLH